MVAGFPRPAGRSLSSLLRRNLTQHSLTQAAVSSNPESHSHSKAADCLGRVCQGVARYWGFLRILTCHEREGQANLSISHMCAIHIHYLCLRIVFWDACEYPMLFKIKKPLYKTSVKPCGPGSIAQLTRTRGSQIQALSRHKLKFSLGNLVQPCLKIR